MWMVAQSSIEIKDTTKNIINVGNFNLILDNENKIKIINFTDQSNLLIFFSGHPVFRETEEKIYDGTDFRNRLKNPDEIREFARSLKGNFVLGIIRENECTILSDRFGVNKFFYSEESQFLASDSIKSIKGLIEANISVESIAKYVLGYHFIGGSTLYGKIRHNEPAEIIKNDKGKVRRFYYWTPNELLALANTNTQIDKISSKLKEVVISNLTEMKGDKISLSLTGGADTRNLLAVFLSLNIRPNLYTYGNPKSVDCIKASKIAQGLNLKHIVHDIKMTPELFSVAAKRVIRDGNGLASFHRAHRLISVEYESAKNDTMLLGTLGGEFIKGVNEDDYIVPSIVFDNWREPCLKKETVVKYLSAKGIVTREFDLEQLVDFFNSEPYFNGSVHERKLAALSYITAHLHDAQDVNLYETVMGSVFTPFLDIDYLELVFSSNFTFEKKESHSAKWRRRIENPLFGADFLKSTYKPLTVFEYSGEHRPDEVLFNKYYAAVKKVTRQAFRRRYPSNFPLDDWMKEFVLQELPKCKDYVLLDRLFALDTLISEVKRDSNGRNEGYWIKYTNPILFSYILNEFGI